MHYASSSSFTVALVASAALFASQAEALPTHRSTSTVSRRAHIASHHQHVARAVPGDAATTLGDHSIVVDASTSSAGSQGGIKNSTINLTSISKRSADREGTLSSFSRVVRSLFGRAVPPAPKVFKALPLTFSPPVSSVSASASTHKKRRGAGHSRRRAVKKPRANSPVKGNTRTLPSGLTLEIPDAAVHQHVTNIKRQRALEVQAKMERRAVNYTLAQAQASVYSAAVAALGDGEPTATPVLNAKAAVPTSFAGLNDTAPLPSSALAVGDAAPTPAKLSPVTLTITLVPSGSNGALIDAATFPTSTSSTRDADASSAAVAVPSSASSGVTANPKATSFAALAAASAYTAPSAPAPISSALSAVKRGMERRVVARRAPVAQVQAEAVKPAMKWYHAPA